MIRIKCSLLHVVVVVRMAARGLLVCVCHGPVNVRVVVPVVLRGVVGVLRGVLVAKILLWRKKFNRKL